MSHTARGRQNLRADLRSTCTGPEQRLPAAYLRQLKAQNDAAAAAAAAAATGGGGGHPQQRPGMVLAGGADRRQAASLSPQQLEQLARQPPGSQRLPRKWGKARKGDDSDDRCRVCAARVVLGGWGGVQSYRFRVEGLV